MKHGIGTLVFASVLIGLLRVVPAARSAMSASAPAAIEVRHDTPDHFQATFTPGVKLFSNRPYTLKECPPRLEGKRFIRNLIGYNRFTVTRSGTLLILARSTQHEAVEGRGFTPEDTPPFQLFGTNPDDAARVYSRYVREGETFEFRVWTIVLGFSEAVRRPGPDWRSNRGKKLYNGIRLPETWPPVHMHPVSTEPMPVPYLDHPPEVIRIDVGRQLFVDDFLIAETDLARTFHYPEKYEGNPVLKPETPLERGTEPPALAARLPELASRPQPLAGPKSGGLWWNPDKQLFELWYEAGWIGTICYAVSRDGLHWERPELDIRAGTNQALPEGLHVDSWTVVRDAWTADPAARYKLFISTGPRPGTCYISPDGIHWRGGTRTGNMGDRSTMFYNPFRHKWIFSIRSGFRGRSRHYWETDDFLHGVQWDDFNLRGIGWEEGQPVIWTAADRRDPPDPELKNTPQLYNLDAVAYESIMLGFYELHRGPPNRQAAEQGTPKITELNFAYSRDGFHWHRPDRNMAIAASRREGTWDRGYVQSLGNLCVVQDDRLWFYYLGFAGDPENTNERSMLSGMYANGATGVAFLRRDGFASMDAEKQGYLTTRPVTFSGQYLFVNAAAPQGAVRAEIRDLNGEPIEPFTLSNSRPFTGDSTLEPLTWRGGSDLSALAGQPVRFHFELTKGSLYAFWVSRDRSGRSDGYVAGGGPGFTGPVDTVGNR
ncbi:hypothetical protein [Kiritimatiella glycovorans]|uniref:Glycosyl hydrolase family 32 n=1 Tax=Kiritimatiella glycovorans TaxID=1307763 RepID=A0A0G3EK85_9BACT|nr:hypothetical protein [Kiritimatiella glycovorans]AKJ64579.1 hypothetical protein L21SP4_01331 [Kiritimatiella glycovorans]